jgi:sirohydrochlorin ferrochelatase
MLNVRIMLAVLALGLLMTRPAFANGSGILLLAHGGSAEWNAHVTALAAQVDRTKPTEVAFGMATRANIQAAVDRLTRRGVSEIVAVPLFVSSWSSVITSTEYLLGRRADAPRELAIFAKMKHSTPAGTSGSGAASAGHDSHAAHEGATAADPTSPVTSPVPIRMTRALNDHPIVAAILTARARSISRQPSEEAVVIVAHGPTGDEENRRWLTDMASLAERMTDAAKFASIDYLTVRDDAPKPVRDQATAELRATVTKRLEEGRRVLIIPLLVSFGGIERGLRQRLEGLSYTMADAGLVPDERLANWVLAMATER